jgi:hypothetical protein
MVDKERDYGPSKATIRRSKLARALFRDIAPFILQKGISEHDAALRSVIGMEACSAAAAAMDARERLRARKRAKARAEQSPPQKVRKKAATPNDSFDERGIFMGGCGERGGGR